jgi:hypothetical protein
MNTYLRVAVGLGCLGCLLVLGAVLLDPACPFPFPPPGDPTLIRSLAKELERSRQLDQRKDDLRRHREAKRHVAEEVIAGHCSLEQALQAFRALEEQWRLPDDTKEFEPNNQGISDDERLGLDVQFVVQEVLADRADEAAEVVGRLRKELQQLLAARRMPPAAPAEGSR